ncbi:MAG: 1-phosphofructokinase family hexose kinase [Erysipelotrichaceae bacterium]|nr:1-phosphofructokinase family hexose kinase [Erysipelotrichaceae bacterium]
MIYTFTLNPAVDYFLTINNDLMIDEVNRGTDAKFKAGGKGLNVSKILSLLGIWSKAVVLLGGFTGDYIREEFQKDQNIDVETIRVDGINRINMKAHYDHKALCINGDGPLADEKTKEELLKAVNEIRSEDVALISGSMMRGLDEEFLIVLSDRIHEKGARLVIDMETVKSETLIRCKPDLIKPNLYELQILLKDPGINTENAKEALSRIREYGIGNILLSLGKDGALLADEEGFLRLEHPHTTLVNKVGAGDAMLAAFIGKLYETGDRELALRYGGAAGNAVASTLDDITAETIEEFLPLMKTGQ